MNHLIRIEKEVKEKGVSCYRILGLNIFSANTSQHDPALLQMQDVPVSKFLGSLSSLYETICLLGSPAPNNWINQMRREGETVTIEGFLGRETRYCQVPISYYGGSFRA